MSDKPRVISPTSHPSRCPEPLKRSLSPFCPTNLRKRRLPSKGPIICIARFASTTNSKMRRVRM